MTDVSTAERVLDLLRQADRLRLPGHRHTADRCLETIDEIREGLRRLHRDLSPKADDRYQRRAPTAAMFPPRDRRAGVIVEHRRRA